MVTVLVGEKERVSCGKVDSQNLGIMFEHDFIRASVEQDSPSTKFDQRGEAPP